MVFPIQEDPIKHTVIKSDGQREWVRQLFLVKKMNGGHWLWKLSSIKIYTNKFPKIQYFSKKYLPLKLEHIFHCKTKICAMVLVYWFCALVWSSICYFPMYSSQVPQPLSNQSDRTNSVRMVWSYLLICFLLSYCFLLKFLVNLFDSLAIYIMLSQPYNISSYQCSATYIWG